MSTIRQRIPSPPPAGRVEKDQLLREAEEKELTEGQKFVLPNFTNKQLLDAVPAHCFHRSALRSSLYILQDGVVLAACAYGYYHIDSFLSRFALSRVAFQAARVALYLSYMFVAGLFGTGIWVIAHEAGHQAFSPSKRINNIVGWVLHSALLVPYHSWRISHGRHHAATAHMTRDEVHVPRTRKQLGHPELTEEGEISGLHISEARQAELREAIETSPLGTFLHVLVTQLFGWPLYLIKNASGQLHYPAWTNHYDPSVILFKEGHKWQIIMSDVGIATTLGLLGFWGYKRSFTEVALMYILPYLWVNHWLVFITYLQHTDPILPHYNANTWTFARGALATIDRTLMGPIGGIAMHGICETHVSHHVSSKIPHYNAWEATEALKQFLGPHYYKSEENMFVSFWKSHRECVFVEDEGDVLFWKNSRGVAQRVAVEEGGSVSDSGIDMGESK